MSSKAGYKVVLTPGEELMAIFQDTRSERRDPASGQSGRVSEDMMPTKLSTEDQEAIDLLKSHGILPAKADKLVTSFGSDAVTDTVEYLVSQVIERKRKSIDNPAGLIIYSLENRLPVPASFVGARKRKAIKDALKRKRIKEQKQMEEIAYSMWLEDQRDRAVREQFSEVELESKLTELATDLAHRDKRVRRMPAKARRDVALRMLRKEITEGIQLPNLDEWRNTAEQTLLF